METKTLLIIAVAAIAVAGGAVYMMISTSDDTTVPNGSTPSKTSDTTIDTGEETSSSSISGTSDFIITFESGSDNCYTVTESSGLTTITFSGMSDSSGSVYSISGTLIGNIVIDAGDYDFELVLNGLTLSSTQEVPICIISGEDVTISAKKGTTNTIYDQRDAVADEDISASIYSKCDLKIQGKGKLVIVSTNNNGIHSKDDLSVKNLTLYVTAVDNCLKGNDSVSITSGTITLNATSGDGIKTSNSELSSSGKQRGSVTINSDDGDTTVTIKAYCDGIDSACDAIIEETNGGSLNISIIAGAGASSATNSPVTGADMMQQRPNGPGDWGGMPGRDSWNQGGGNSEGNKNVTSYSCKGIKASNEIVIKSGTVTIDAYDDALHANNDEYLESGAIPSGNITISGGTVVLNSLDDGVHADGTLLISGGTVNVTGSYEALEGRNITISGGTISLISDDDGVNAIGNGLILSGGYLYVFAGGDGLDTNSSSISFKGTDVVIVSTSGGNSAIDADYSYTYTSGTILAICPNGMTNEITCSSAFKSYGTQKSLGSLKAGTVVTASVSGTIMAAVEIPTSISNASAFYIGSTNATISTGSVSGLDSNGVYLKS
ncbi:MAG: carbohydrate-binding domain-containing protein [Candidatus Methanomethylophilaceae archaeon]|nr:carbohydrate-binding domain-containing protein [Candidatus Methanomethylophilaceae archaeon]